MLGESTDQHVSDGEKSTARQVQHAHAFAERQVVDLAHILVDDGVSGAEDFDPINHRRAR